ncbi:hypothetical protein RR46_00968 [Papilio xuthus]|uniref:Uncharacterized protein n=1 Tax=Papilio xuthus TaxID=66420 RepID=A0A0N1IN51_PAPXU|nr:hypothetical protein RR46_00968 [Papilio xuthus]
MSGFFITVGGKRAAGTPRCSTTSMDISNTRGTADALPAFEVVIRFLKDPKSYWFGNTAVDRPFHNAAVRGRKFRANRTVVDCQLRDGVDGTWVCRGGH